MDGPFVLERHSLGQAAGDAARVMARRGDCVGALEAFDDAIRVSLDYTLYRDRGLCHERLDQPWPAIDDYRVYLSHAPDATDADDIRNRLQRLEERMGVGGPPPQPTEGIVVTPHGGREYDSTRAEEELNDGGPLRNGRGWVLAAIFGVRSWFAPSGFNNGSWAEMGGVRVGYAFNRTSSLYGEIGYEGFSTNDPQDNATLRGLSAQFAYEARVPFTRDRDNVLLFGFGMSHEQLFASSSTPLVTINPSLLGIGPRGRVGYRRNFGSGAALEVTFDAAYDHFFNLSVANADSNAGFIGVNIGVVFALNKAPR